ncbi:hypothetical protein [Aureibacter tunicatorum]|uniref:Uncharacterized protein n=1 Tax=Aureibacter tunicatorum TaxID=866807 RepID=A0AAE3XSY1_9BACT|nr:hypothetical protein [Aureibacter tunicatorum]MDR6241039.1 hypothetical protein [Aureibacter tunicatorum]BDD03817.1 hypothetical protein AUTU_13000 [Aureibacter tunicatorum]
MLKSKAKFESKHTATGTIQQKGASIEHASSQKHPPQTHSNYSPIQRMLTRENVEHMLEDPIHNISSYRPWEEAPPSSPTEPGPILTVHESQELEIPPQAMTSLPPGSTLDKYSLKVMSYKSKTQLQSEDSHTDFLESVYNFKGTLATHTPKSFGASMSQSTRRKEQSSEEDYLFVEKTTPVGDLSDEHFMTDELLQIDARLDEIENEEEQLEKELRSYSSGIGQLGDNTVHDLNKALTERKSEYMAPLWKQEAKIASIEHMLEESYPSVLMARSMGEGGDQLKGKSKNDWIREYEDRQQQLEQAKRELEEFKRRPENKRFNMAHPDFLEYTAKEQQALDDYLASPEHTQQWGNFLPRKVKLKQLEESKKRLNEFREKELKRLKKEPLRTAREVRLLHGESDSYFRTKKAIEKRLKPQRDALKRKQDQLKKETDSYNAANPEAETRYRNQTLEEEIKGLTQVINDEYKELEKTVPLRVDTVSLPTQTPKKSTDRSHPLIVKVLDLIGAYHDVDSTFRGGAKHPLEEQTEREYDAWSTKLSEEHSAYWPLKLQGDELAGKLDPFRKALHQTYERLKKQGLDHRSILEHTDYTQANADFTEKNQEYEAFLASTQEQRMQFFQVKAKVEELEKKKKEASYSKDFPAPEKLKDDRSMWEYGGEREYKDKVSLKMLELAKRLSNPSGERSSQDQELLKAMERKMTLSETEMLHAISGVGDVDQDGLAKKLHARKQYHLGMMARKWQKSISRTGKEEFESFLWNVDGYTPSEAASNLTQGVHANPQLVELATNRVALHPSEIMKAASELGLETSEMEEALTRSKASKVLDILSGHDKDKSSKSAAAELAFTGHSAFSEDLKRELADMKDQMIGMSKLAMKKQVNVKDIERKNHQKLQLLHEIEHTIYEWYNMHPVDRFGNSHPFTLVMMFVLDDIQKEHHTQVKFGLENNLPVWVPGRDEMETKAFEEETAKNAALTPLFDQKREEYRILSDQLNEPIVRLQRELNKSTEHNPATRQALAKAIKKRNSELAKFNQVHDAKIEKVQRQWKARCTASSKLREIDETWHSLTVKRGSNNRMIGDMGRDLNENDIGIIAMMAKLMRTPIGMKLLQDVDQSERVTLHPILGGERPTRIESHHGKVSDGLVSLDRQDELQIQSAVRSDSLMSYAGKLRSGGFRSKPVPHQVLTPAFVDFGRGLAEAMYYLGDTRDSNPDFMKFVRNKSPHQKYREIEKDYFALKENELRRSIGLGERDEYTHEYNPIFGELIF